MDALPSQNIYEGRRLKRK